MNTDILRLLPLPLLIAVWAILSVIMVIVNVLFAAGVASDTGELRREGVETQFVGPVMWTFATLFGGVFVVAVYWVIHHSTLRRVEAPGADAAKYTSI